MYNFVNPDEVVISAHSPVDRDGISLGYSCESRVTIL